MIPTDIQEFALSNPEVLIALTVVLYIGARLQRTLTYPEYRFLHLGKCFLFGYLDQWARNHGRPLVRHKQSTENSHEYLTTADMGPRQTYMQLIEAGCTPHLIATAKKRPNQWSHSQLVKLGADNKQSEFYLFAAGNGETDIYGHVEGAFTDPKAHLTDKQTKAQLPSGF